MAQFTCNLENMLRNDRVLKCRYYLYMKLELLIKKRTAIMIGLSEQYLNKYDFIFENIINYKIYNQCNNINNWGLYKQILLFMNLCFM